MSLTRKRVGALKRLSFSNVLTFQGFNVRASASLFAKNDSRLCQIVWRKLHRHFVARYNPNEMLAHFARDMGKDIASAGEIDTKHRARQDVGHSAFGHDLLFLRHRAANIRGNTCGSRLAQARSGGLSSVAVMQTVLSASRILAELVQRDRWQIFSKLLTFPPRAGLAKLIHGCEAITIKHRPDVARRLVRKRVPREQAAHVM